MSGWRGLTVASLVAVSGVAVARLDAHQWLVRMQTAAHTLNYTGTFVYRHGATLAALHIIHRVASGQVTERLTTLDGARQVIVRGDGRIACYLPRAHVVYSERRVPLAPDFPGSVAARLTPPARFYAVRLGGLDRVAGHEARLVVIAPRDHYRYGYRLWADRHNGLLLKAVVITDTDRAVEQFLFTRLTVQPHIAASAIRLMGVSGTKTFTIRRSELWPDPHPSWIVTRLPPGFHLARALLRRSAGHGRPVQHLVYSDGFSGVSVWVSHQRAPAGMRPQLYRLGALHVFRAAVDHRQVTALGDVPTRTVEMMALSVRRVSPRTSVLPRLH